MRSEGGLLDGDERGCSKEGCSVASSNPRLNDFQACEEGRRESAGTVSRASEGGASPSGTHGRSRTSDPRGRLARGCGKLQ